MIENNKQLDLISPFSIKKAKGLVLMSGYILVQCISIPALSSGCNVEIKKQISFAKGQVCWAFDGQANTFNGQFHEGQAISVRMIGLGQYESGQEWGNLDPSATGPREQVFISDSQPGVPNGELTFVAPMTGIYQFTVSPCAYWSSRVKVEICAK